MKEIMADDFEAYLKESQKAFDTVELRPEMQACSEVLFEAFERNFESKAEPFAGPWPPRKDSLPHPLLNKSGAMKAAATNTGSGTFLQVNDDGVATGVSLEVIPYARAQNRGYRPRNLPRRMYLRPDQEALDECGKIILLGQRRRIVGT